MNSRKILITHSSSDLYGAGKIIFQVAELLVANDWQVVFVLTEQGPLVEKLRALGVDVRVFNLGVFRKKYLNPVGLIDRFFALSLAIIRLTTLIFSERVSLVYSNTSVVWASGISAKVTGRNHIWHVHEIPFGNRAYIKLTGKMLRLFSTKVIAVSESVKAFWVRALKDGQVERIYNGVVSIPQNERDQDSRLPLNENDIVITNISRIIPYKGHLYFLEVASALFAVRKDLKFLIVGSSTPGYEEYVDSVHKKIEELGLNEVVFMLGHREDVKDILKRTDVYYHSAIEPDPLPTVIFEAQIAGTTVVANNLGGPTEMIIHNETGLLLDYDNPKNAAQCIQELLEDRNKMSRFSECAKVRLNKEFSEQEFNNRILSLIDNTLAE